MKLDIQAVSNGAVRAVAADQPRRYDRLDLAFHLERLEVLDQKALGVPLGVS